MRIRAFLLLLLLMIVMRAAGQTSSPPPERDFQSWNEVTVAFPIVKTKDNSGRNIDRLSLLLLGTSRLGQNRFYPVDERIGVGLDLRLRKGVAFTPSYLYRHTEAGRGRHATEHQIRFDLGLEKAFKHFSIKDRPRIEYRVRNSAPDVINFRNRISIKFPVKRNDREMFAPFVADEQFYDFSAGKWFANEVSAGIVKKLNSSTSAEFYYMFRHNSAGLPRTTNIVGMSLRFRVD